MKAFLSYNFNDNISEITKLLNEQDIEVFDSRNDIEYGSSFQKANRTVRSKSLEELTN